MYSASVLDMTVLFCLFDDHLTNLSPNSCIFPNVLSLVSWQPAWSASAKAVRAMQESFEYHWPIFMVSLRFLIQFGFSYPSGVSIGSQVSIPYFLSDSRAYLDWFKKMPLGLCEIWSPRKNDSLPIINILNFEHMIFENVSQRSGLVEDHEPFGNFWESRNDESNSSPACEHGFKL
ncbi:hypothetical protein Tco_1229993 [Tanacetum coccineum]